MKRVFMVNDNYVTAEEYANFIADLFAQGWTLEPPPKLKP